MMMTEQTALSLPGLRSHVQYTQTDTVRNYKFTIRTVWQIIKDRLRSVYNRKIVPHYVLFKRRGRRGLSIRTLCTGHKRSFRSVYDRKIASHFGVLDFNHVLFERRGHNSLSIRTVWTDRKRSLQSVYGPSSASHQVFEAKEIMNRRILPQQTSQIYMYTSFFKRERQHEPFRAKEIINRGNCNTL